MGAGALALVVISALLHVAWNLRSRQVRPSAAFFALSLLASMAALAPGLVIGWSHLPALLAVAWPSLLGTAVFSTLYNVALAAAYRNGDLSLVYPLARSLAPVCVVAFGLLVGRGAQMGWGLYAGVPAIVLACVVLPLEGLEWKELRRLLDARVLLPLFTAVATAGYTLCDDTGVKPGRRRHRARSPPHRPAVRLRARGRHGLVLCCCGSSSLLRAAAGLAWAWREQRAAAIGVGVASYLSYACVLAAMGLASEVSYVAAFRQLGIPLSVLAGAWLLEERVGPFRALGTAIATLGLVFVALG